MADTALQAVAHTPAYRRLTDPDRAYILRLHEQGRTQVEIAERIGCDQATVSRWLKQCEDSTKDATAYLKGSALRMARHIVQKGRAQDHVATLKGIGVLEERESQGLTVLVGSGGTVNIGLLHAGTSGLSPQLTGDLHKLSD